MMMAIQVLLILFFVVGYDYNIICNAFSTSSYYNRRAAVLTIQLSQSSSSDTNDNNKSSTSEFNRRDAIGQAYRSAAAITAISTSTIFTNPLVSNANDIEGVVSIPQSTSAPTFTSKMEGGQSVTVFKTNSGLQYIDIVEGQGASPKYGNFISIAYKGFVKLPGAKGKSFDLDEFDEEKQYLIKHGNGRNIPGLDEGWHTMKVGGKRRIIIPPKLGYVTFGLGPLPEGPYGRWKLNRLIGRMVELKGGNLIFDVEMRSILEDEADQGYYDDESLSPEDFATLSQNIEGQQRQARNL